MNLGDRDAVTYIRSYHKAASWRRVLVALHSSSYVIVKLKSQVRARSKYVTVIVGDHKG